MMLLGRGLDARDNQTRQMQDAVSNVEKHFGELCQIFAGYVRKTARLRDKADLLVNEIYAYAATETPNLKVGLKNFADEFSRLQDYRQAEVDRLEAKVVEPLKCYGTIVKLKRDDLRATLTAKSREAKQLSQLEKTRQRNPSDLHVIAENELHRASLDATRTTRHLEETIDNFEKQKIRDIKNIFSEFITIEMLFHGKALEIYTAAYQNIQNIDENEDLEISRRMLRKDEEEDEEEDEDDEEDDEEDEFDATKEMMLTWIHSCLDCVTSLLNTPAHSLGIKGLRLFC
ncbi:CBY1-interacting BAR domain-containing protein 1 isoform X4 [Passer domesticus]|uniref:CBY1-interacting BAR domain-containing protein 1 isoform X4 n=1 Tax=Passer domesticus TaxID=48849 RepID=UPI0030FECD10